MLLLLLACRLTDADVDAALDPDGDGYGPEEDCAPRDAAVYPGAEEVCDDGAVNDCAVLAKDARAWCRLDGELSASRADLKVVGEREGDLAGHGVSIVGDVDGDGLADLLVGASNVDTAYLLLSSGALATGGRSVDLGAADLKLIGPEVASGVGGAVTGAGDVDGDGRADLLVASNTSGLGGSHSGAVYLLRSKGALSAGLSSINLGAADLILVGEEAGDQAGLSVHSAGDVDGDDLADVMVGARFHSAGGYVAGAAYLLLSSSALNTTSSTLDLSSADFKFVGEQSAEAAGRTVSGGGDVDGDGYADVVVGATEQRRGGEAAGGVYLLLSSGLLDSGSATLSLSVADLIVVGEDEYDYAGNSVSSAGDVDGDGYADLFVGAPGQQNSAGDWAGAAYLLLSSGTLNSALASAAGGVAVLDLENADLKLVGEEAGDWSGYLVSSAGDIDGDGCADLTVGSAQQHRATPVPGLAYVFLSSGALAEAGSSLGLGDADVKLVGESAGDYAGLDVSTSGDVNGDGVDDLFMGALYNDTGGTDAGAAYLLYGRTF